MLKKGIRLDVAGYYSMNSSHEFTFSRLKRICVSSRRTHLSCFFALTTFAELQIEDFNRTAKYYVNKICNRNHLPSASPSTGKKDPEFEDVLLSH